MLTFDETEWTFRRARYEQLRESVDQLQERVALSAGERASGRDELDSIIGAFGSSSDPQALRGGLDNWARVNRHYGFAGANGAMFLNQLVNDSDPGQITPLLHQAMAPPHSAEEAAARFDVLIDHVELLRQEGSSAAAGRVPSLLSWFWWIDDPKNWPVMFSSGARFLDDLGFLSTSSGHWERYADYRRHVQQFGPFAEVEQVFSHAEPSTVGLDPTGVERCLRIPTMARSPEDDNGTYDASLASVTVLKRMVETAGAALEPAVSEILGPVKAYFPSEFWVPKAKRLRQDIWVSWRPQLDGLQPFLFLVIDAEGARVGLYASSQQKGGKGFAADVHAALADHEPEEYEWLGWGPKTNNGWMYELLGRTVPFEELTTWNGLTSAIEVTARELRACFQLVSDKYGSSQLPEPAELPSDGEADTELAALRDEYLEQTGYPTDSDQQHRAARVRFATLLTATRLAAISPGDLRAIAGGNGYGAPGPQSVLFTTLKEGGDQALDRLLSAVQYLLWDDVDAVQIRINRVMDEQDLGLRGFKESVIAKMLAIAHPDQFLPVFPFTGDKGKAALMGVLDLDPPSLTTDAGTRHVLANDALRAVTEPLLPGDPWAQAQFLYWLQAREAAAGVDDVVEVDADLLGHTADELEMPRQFLEQIHSLLDEHQQVIFYGPPGTGKTFVAQHLARAIAPEDSRRMLVQFHPSTSYEDFFEGFRPGQSSDGGISYSLVDGPLKIMAERAAEDPLGRPHLLIIDEINRANLAKVLGELLFLLEYRDAEIRPMYRPEESFSLPSNLWIIGTMNTADRSIATVDAALRRRFQFVPFIPDDRDENPISGLLARWLVKNGEPEWVADLVDSVNQRLRKELGGDHLLLGPSYFMRKGLDEDRLRLIWMYQIQPLIDDLLFGSPKAQTFNFDKVYAEFSQARNAAETAVSDI